MNQVRRTTIWVNVLGGMAVLGSYVPVTIAPGMGDALWGGVPESLRPLYGVSMVLATVGYLLFTWHLVFCMRPETDRTVNGARLALVPWVYGAALVPSALWLPLTRRWLTDPNDFLWALIRLDLAVVGVASVALVVIVATLQPARPGKAWAVFGCACFAFQTAILDAMVWPAFFRLF